MCRVTKKNIQEEESIIFIFSDQRTESSTLFHVTTLWWVYSALPSGSELWYKWRLCDLVNFKFQVYSSCLFLSCSREVYKNYIFNIFANLKMRFCISSNVKKFFREIRLCDSISRFFARFSFHSRSILSN